MKRWFIYGLHGAICQHITLHGKYIARYKYISLFNLLNIYHNETCFETRLTASAVWWSESLAIDQEVLGSIPGAARFSEK
jgi:hypothetical protein